MNSNPNTSPPRLFSLWHAEDQELRSHIDQMRQWMNEVNQLGIPHFGEAGDRLASLRKRLSQHFNREDEIIESLAANSGDSATAIEDLRSRSQSEHQQLLNRVDELSHRLNLIDPPFSSWTAATQEIEGFVDELQRHEQAESEQLTAAADVNQA